MAEDYSAEMKLRRFFLTREKYPWSILASYSCFFFALSNILLYIVMMDAGSLVRCKKVILNDLEERSGVFFSVCYFFFLMCHHLVKTPMQASVHCL